MAKDEKERQQRLRAAQAASQLTFINDAYIPTNPLPQAQSSPAIGHHEQQPLPSPGLMEYPGSYDEFFYSPCFPSPQSCYDSDTSPFFNNEYPSPSLSYAPSTPTMSLYTPSLDEDLSGSFDLDPSLFMESSTGQALDAFGLTPLPSTPSPRLQPERHRSSSLPTPLTPPRSIPTSAPRQIERTRPPLTSYMSNPYNIPTSNSIHYNNMNVNGHMNMNMNMNANDKLGHYYGAEQVQPNYQTYMGQGASVDGLQSGRIPLHYAMHSPTPTL